MIKKIIWLSYVFSVFTVIAFADKAEFYMISNFSYLIMMILMGSYILIYNPKVSKKALVFLPFLVFCFVSWVWSVDKAATLVRSMTILKLFVCFVLLVLYLLQTKEISHYINGLAISGVAVFIYVLFSYGISGLRILMSEGIRVGGDIVNQNTLATFLALSVVILFGRFWQKRQFAFLLIVIPMSLVIALTGSKKGFLDIVIGIVILFFLSQQGTAGNGKVVRVIAGIAIGCISMGVIWNMEAFSLVRSRYEVMFDFMSDSSKVVDYSTRARQMMINAGIQQFLNTPLLGIGIGASGVITQKILGFNSYLHNNYVELLATGGIVGFLAFYIPNIKMFVGLWKKRYSIDYRILLTLLIILLVNGYASVGYFSRIDYTVYGLITAALLVYRHEDTVMDE